jgi:hypothetical protein
MTAAEFHESILRLLRREPFEPFEIELASGEILPVDYPEMICTNGGSGAWGRPVGDIILFDYTDTVRFRTPARAPA